MSSKFPLSRGSLLKICQGSVVDDPVLQMVSTKRIAGTSTERYRLLISDGQYQNSYGMLATQLNPMIHDGTLCEHSVVKVKKLQCNNMQGKKVIILLELEVLQSGKDVGGKIDTPISINPDGTIPPGSGDENKRPTNNAPQSVGTPNKRSSSEAPVGQPAAKKSMFDSSVGSNLTSSNIFPIASLTPYQNKWTIKARVTHKSDIRRWSNARGEGHLFSFDLVDESGEIRATAFKEQCDKYYNLCEVGKVYLINNCALKPANKQYSTLNNDYELTFRDSTEMQMVSDEDTSAIPSLSFEFVKISDLSANDKDKTVDIIGVCKSAGDVATITSQKTGKELRKKDITLVDKSMSEINVTLWGGQAESFDGAGNPVVAIKNVRVSDYNGVSLSSVGSSTVQINPDMPEVFDLKGWFEGLDESSKASFESKTQARTGMGGGGEGRQDSIKTFGEVKAERLGQGSERGDYYSAIGTVVMLQKERALYQACSKTGQDGKGCNKKVQDLGNGTYRCERCNEEMDSFNWRLILSFNACDSTDNNWAQAFQDEGEKLLGMSAQEVGDLSVHNPEEFGKVFQRAAFQKFHMRMRCKTDNYNDQERVRHTLLSATKVDNWSDHCRNLIKAIREAGRELPDGFDESLYA